MGMKKRIVTVEVPIVPLGREWGSRFCLAARLTDLRFADLSL